MDQIISPSLHILLGIVLIGYNVLNDEYKVIDGLSHRKDRRDAMEEWEVASLAHSAAVGRGKEHTNDIITMPNVMDRQEAVLGSDFKRNEEIASTSTVSLIAR